MTLAILHFVSQAQQTGQAVVITSWVELLTVLSLITLGVGAYRHLECHRDGCHRLGRFTHGHLKLCHIHHPLVPDDGQITAKDIDAVTKQL